MTDTVPVVEVSDDAFLGEALRILQPQSGYRAGIDAVLLAASVADTGGPVRILDLGAGVGVIGLCAARRMPEAQVVLVERAPELAALARQNALRNGLDSRVTVVDGDVTGNAAAPRLDVLRDETFDVVLANPPFHTLGHGTSAHTPLKAASHEMPPESLDAWLRFAARMARPGGTFTMIHKAEAAREILAACAQRFGAVQLTPVYARAGEPAIRVIVRGLKGSRARMSIGAPLILHGEGHAFTPTIDAVLRRGEPLAI